MKRILIVDDDPAVGRSLSRGLEAHGGFEVRTETHGTRAVAAARDFKPDMILLDIVLPDMDGDEIARRLEADRLLRDIPIVLVTGIVSRGELAEGATDSAGRRILPKPVEIEDLLGVVSEVLGV